jgi:hypothetical protein
VEDIAFSSPNETFGLALSIAHKKMGEEFGCYSLRFGAMGRAQENPVPRVGKNDSNLVADRASFPGCVRFSIGNTWRMNNDRPQWQRIPKEKRSPVFRFLK